MQQKLVNKYNQKDTLLLLSSFPLKNGEVADENAVARYTKLLISNLPKDQKVVVISEKRQKSDKSYEIGSNVLVVPSYKVNSGTLTLDISRSLNLFPNVNSLLVQFEFSIFGGKNSLPQILLLLLEQRLKGRYLSIMFHQVVDDIGSLSGHLGLSKKGLKTNMFNLSLRAFYTSIGLIVNAVLVHDSFLSEKIAKYININKIHVIPHGNNSVKRLSHNKVEVARKTLGFSKNDFVVLAFGYHSWYKGTDWIVKAVGESNKQVMQNNIKLLLTGDQSPTLKNTSAYKKYHSTLMKVINNYSDTTTTTGFVAENDVEKMFAAADVVVFPYRTRMSASGALALALSYQKPIIISKPFATNFIEKDMQNSLKQNDINLKEIVFEFNQKSFNKALITIKNNKRSRNRLSKLGEDITNSRSWANISMHYLQSAKKQTASKLLPSKKFSYSAG